MINDIWRSLRSLPMWVQLWVVIILVPVNMLPLLWWSEDRGPLIAFLALAGMAPNLIVMARERGFSNTMALPHLVFWIPLVLVIVNTLTDTTLSSSFRSFLYVLLIVDIISLAFDIPDAIRWKRGERDVARPDSTPQ